MLAFFLVAVLAAEPDSEWLIEFATQYNVNAVARALATLKKMPVKKNAKDGDDAFPSLREKQKTLAAAEERLKLAKQLAKGEGAVPLIVGTPSVGDCGRIDANFNVLQVVSDKEMIVRVRDDFVGGSHVYLAWVDMDTAGVTDSQNITFSAPVRVVGTKRYTNLLGGSNTILHIVSWSEDEKRRFFELVKSPIVEK